MSNNVDFAVAVDIVNRKIAELNIKLSLNKTKKLEDELNKYLEFKKEIYNGNSLVIKKIIDDKIG